MAVVNWEAHRREKEQEEQYEKLKQELSGKPEWHLALEHLRRKEDTMEEQKKQIEKYQQFFRMLKSFLPKSFSMWDPIG